MARWTLLDTLAFLLLLSLLLPSLLIMFIPSTYKRHASLWKARSLAKTLSTVSNVRLMPPNSLRIPCVFAPDSMIAFLMLRKMLARNLKPMELSNEKISS